MKAKLACIALAAICTLPALAQPQKYPAKPVRVLIGFPPGGGEDFHARTVAQKLTELLGQQVIVDHRPGAGGAIAWDLVAKSAPDGYTLTITGGGLTAAPSIYPKFPFDPARDLTAVAQISEHQYMLVSHRSVPARTIADLIAIARKSPGKLNYSSSGIGSMPHLAGALFVSQAKVNIVHVPYKGGAASLLDVIAGQCDMTIGTIPSVHPHVQAGKVRAMAVTGRKRARMAPDVPTIAESGLAGYELSSWYGVFAPAAVPAEIVGQLGGAVLKAVQMPDVQERLLQVGSEPAPASGEQLAQRVRSDLAKFAEIARIAGARAE
jgi:tripartite-type tricarboxylate transporter receptor subunit TctC